MSEFGERTRPQPGAAARGRSLGHRLGAKQLNQNRESNYFKNRLGGASERYKGTQHIVPKILAKQHQEKICDNNHHHARNQPAGRSGVFMISKRFGLRGCKTHKGFYETRHLDYT